MTLRDAKVLLLHKAQHRTFSELVHRTLADKTLSTVINAEEEINPVNGQPLFRDFFDAFYWAACTLTTVGYGDLYPISNTGRVISILSSIVGIAIIALPSGIITAGYMDELKLRKELKEREENAPLASAE